jgi:hypothetical protein
VVTGNVGSRDNSFLLDQFSKLFRRTLEGKLCRVLRIETGDGKHLFANTEEQIISPLHTFSDVL